MELLELPQPITLKQSLTSMNVGESCLAPHGYKPNYVRKFMRDLKKDGYLFTSTTKTGKFIITRLK